MWIWSIRNSVNQVSTFLMGSQVCMLFAGDRTLTRLGESVPVEQFFTHLGNFSLNKLRKCDTLVKNLRNHLVTPRCMTREVVSSNPIQQLGHGAP